MFFVLKRDKFKNNIKEKGRLWGEPSFFWKKDWGKFLWFLEYQGIYRTIIVLILEFYSGGSYGNYLPIFGQFC